MGEGDGPQHRTLSATSQAPALGGTGCLPGGSDRRRRRCGVDRELLATITAVLGLVAAVLELSLVALQLRRERRQQRRERGYRDVAE